MKERRWIVHKPDGGFTGPFTAVEIREALRKGELDPSTMVSPEGSAIKREILSTDELFQTDEVLYQSTDATSIVDTIKGKSSFLGLAAPDEAGTLGGHEFTSRSQAKDKPREGKRKKYFLTDRQGKSSKKMSAAEILYLYKKGRLSRDTRVCKEGSPHSIQLREFLKAYQTGGLKQLNPERSRGFDPNKSQLHPSPRKEHSVTPQVRRLTAQTVIFTISFAGLLLLCVWLLSDRLHKQEPEAETARRGNLPQMPLPTAKIDEPARKKTLPGERERQLNRRSLKTPPIAKAPLPAGLPAELTASLRGLEDKSGQIHVFGPLSFSSKDLEECSIKCQIKMRDLSGKDVLVIFFKAAYIAQLSGKGSRIYIQATVGARGKTLYLSKVF